MVSVIILKYYMEPPYLVNDTNLSCFIPVVMSQELQFGHHPQTPSSEFKKSMIVFT